MSDSAGISSKEQLVMPTVVMVALAVIGYLTTQPSLQSARPRARVSGEFPYPAANPATQAFYARLWEDPLEMSYEHHERQSPIKSGLAEVREIFSTGDDHTAEDIGESFQVFVRDKLICLPVLLPGSPHGDDHEDRRRTAFAVYSGLTHCGYSYVFPGRMSYVDVRVDITVENFKDPLRQQPFRVPFKVFRRGEQGNQRPEFNDDDYLMVLWINEDLAGFRPLDVIGQILKTLFSDAETRQKNVHARILGPFTSDALLTITDELNQQYDEGGKTPEEAESETMPGLSTLRGCFNPTVFSPRATMPQRLIDERVEHREQVVRPEIPIVRTIGCDEALSEELAKELDLRCKFERGSKIVLLTEADTAYGQAFGGVFKAAVRKTLGCVKIKEFSYLRGIDGEIPGRPAPPKTSTDASGGQGNSTGQQGGGDVRPTGNSQLDYLARLASELVEIDGQTDLASGHAIAGVGIIGTDVYDKLLILRALRKRLPNAVFFTTDLDAEFADPSEQETTRNLVVASHFGLKLAPRLQGKTPSFRDSYQTATYFATLLALGNQLLLRGELVSPTNPWGYASDRNETLKLHPLRFEIGLNGPYQLTFVGDRRKSAMGRTQPPGPREGASDRRSKTTASWYLGAVIALGLCLLVYVTPLRQALELGFTPGPNWSLLAVLGGAALLIFVLGVVPFWWIRGDHYSPDGQPFSLSEGIGLWPSTLVRYQAAWLAAILTLAASLKLRKSTKELGKNLIDSDASETAGWRALWENVQTFHFLRAVGTIRKELLQMNWPKVSSDGSKQTASEFYRDFAQRNTWYLRLLRIAPLTICYFVFAVCLSKAAGLPARPYRGPLSDHTSLWVLGVSFFAVVALSFLVVDATQLCRRFIDALKNATLDWTSRDLEQLGTKRGVAVVADDASQAVDNVKKTDALQSLQQLFTIRKMADCSNVAGKLIPYPFIIVFLMVVARLPAFEYPDVTWVIILLLATLLVAIALTGWSLRKSARALREDFVSRLHDQVAKYAGDAVTVEKLKETIRAIESEDDGAFGSILSDPLVTALAIPFGGATGVLLLQQLLPALLI